MLQIIILKTKQIQSKPKVYFSLRKYEKKGSFDILTGIIEHVTLVQLMDYLGNVNHYISVVGYCIFDSKYEKSLLLNKESLDIIFAPSVGEEQVTVFELVFNALIYLCSTAHLKKD